MKNKANYIEALQQNNPKLIQRIYKEHFPQIEKLVKAHNGTEEDAWEVFQDTLILILKESRENNFKLKSPFPSFLMDVGELLWSKKAREKYQKKIGKDKNIYLAVLEKKARNKAHVTLYKEIFKMLEPGCQQTLALFFDKKKFKELSYLLSYVSEEEAKQQKYSCAQKFIELVKANPGYKMLKQQENKEE